MNCGFIRKYVPFGYKPKNCVYQLIDNYALFYYRFIKDNNQNNEYWQDISNTPRVYTWSGNVFERVCLERIAQIKSALGIRGVHTEVNSWQCNRDEDNGIYGSQIDLLIVRRDQIINVCEMKYSESEYMADARFDRDVRRKISVFKKKTETKCAVHPILVTTYGLETNSYSGDIQAVITSDSLFSN